MTFEHLRLLGSSSVVPKNFASLVQLNLYPLIYGFCIDLSSTKKLPWGCDNHGLDTHHLLVPSCGSV